MSVKKAGVPFYVKVVTDKNLFGKADGFKLSYYDESDPNPVAIDVDVDFIEVMRNVEGNSSTASADAFVGDRAIVVEDGTVFADGDVVQDANGNIYYVETISGNTLHIRGKLVADIASGDTITQVGNTGIYQAPLTIDTPGNFTIEVANPEENMENVAFSVEVVEETLDDAQEKLDAIMDELGAVRAKVRYKVFS